MKKYIVLLLIVLGLGGCGICFAEEEYADIHDKMFTMIFDLHSKQMGYDRTEQICGFGMTMIKKGYANYKGIKYYPDKKGFIVINTNEVK